MTVVTAKALKLAAETTLKAHLGEALLYLATAENMKLTMPLSWQRLADFATQFGDEQSPAIVVVCHGIEGEPVTRADGGDEAVWLVETIVVVHGRSWEETTDRVGAMVAAVRTTYNRYPALGGISSSAKQVSEGYDTLGQNADRTIGAGSVTFRFRCVSEHVAPVTEVDVATVTVLGTVNLVVP